MAVGELSFGFGGDTGAKTPEELAKRRAIAEALAGRIFGTAPKNVGEGLSAIGQALALRSMNARNAKAETAGRESAASAFEPIIAALGGGGFPSAPAAPGGGSVASADPNVGSTIDFANAGPPADLSGDKQAFISALLPAAMEESKRTGVDPRIIVAQAAQETGWGRSAPGNNYFGIKSHGKGGGQTFATHEVINGKRVAMNDSFRQFASPADSVRGYGDFLLENPRYRPMMQAQGLDAQLQALGASGYATDPNYAQSVGSIARGIPLPEQAPAQVASLDQSIGLPPELAAVGAEQGLPADHPGLAAIAGIQQQAASGTHTMPDGSVMSDAAMPAQSSAGTMVPGEPVATSPAGNRALKAIMGPQSMTGGAPMPMQGAPTASLPSTGRPMLPNADGSVSTEESITITDPRINNGSPTNIPSIWGGRRTAGENEAIEQALRSGQQFPAFGSIDEAVSAARQRSDMLGQEVQAVQTAQAQQPMPEMAGNVPDIRGPSGVSLPQLLQAAQNPWLSDGQRSIINALIGQEMQKNDPMRQMEMERARLELEALRNPQGDPFSLSPGEIRFDAQGNQIATGGEKPRDLPTDVQEYEYAKGQGFEGSFVDFQLAQKKASATSVTTNVGGGDKFYEELDKSQAGIFTGLSEAGVQGRSKLAQIDRLEGLLGQAQTGGMAMLKQAAGEYGINTEGLSDIQAAQALINELVPQQRQPGSGPMSDADLALFKQSLPRLINQPGGNQMIVDTMRGITQYQIQMGEIADAVADRAMTPSEARKAIRELPNPLAEFGKPKKVEIDGYTIEEVE